MIKADFHVHSEFSSDSKAGLSSIIERAIELDMDTICITDHHDMDYQKTVNNPLSFQLDVDRYIMAMEEIKKKYCSKIDILTGVELGLMSYLKDEIHKLVEEYKFDFIIGSSHLVKGKDPYFKSFYEGRTEQQAYAEYFESILENVKSINDYNVYGHLDYVVRYGPNKNKYFKVSDYEDTLEEALKVIIQNGKGIEINTAGLRKGLGYVHPHKDILKLYKSLGGEIVTVGSDAHIPEDIGYGFKDAACLLQEVGFEYYTVFKNQQPEFYKISL